MSSCEALPTRLLNETTPSTSPASSFITGSRVILTITRGDTGRRQLDSSLIVTKCKDV